MEASKSHELSELFARTIASEMRSEWDSVEINYEHFPWRDMCFEQLVSVYFRGGERLQFTPSLDAVDLLVALKQALPPGAEPWTHLLFRMSSDGQFKFDFKYGVPPLAAESIRYADGSVH